MNKLFIDLKQFISRYRYILIYVCACLGYMIIHQYSRSVDMWAWVPWSKNIATVPFYDIYNKAPDINYYPLFLYVIKAYTYIISYFTHDGVTNENLEQYWFLIKSFVLCFNIVGAIILFILYGNNLKGLKLFLLFLLFFNPVSTYNTVFFGQVDSMYVVLGFLSVVCALRGKFVFSASLALIALNLKPQAIVVGPIATILFIKYMCDNAFKTVVTTIIKMIITVFIIQTVIYLPFILHGTFISLIAHLRNIKPYGLTCSAFNLWMIYSKIVNNFTLGRDPTNIQINIGYVLFIISMIIICIPLVVYGVIKKRCNHTIVFLSAFLIGFAPYLFMTGMHERYAEIIIFMSFAYALLSKRYLIYVFSVVVYSITLRFSLHDLFFKDHSNTMTLLAVLMFLIWFYGFYELYISYKKINLKESA